MSHRFAVLAIVLAVVLSAASLSALWVGAADALVTASGPMKHIPVEQISNYRRGWLELAGCVRHDLAVVVAQDGTIFRLGEDGPAADSDDRVYTPITARADCDDDKPPARIYALIEDADSATTTLARVGRQGIVPPSIPAVVRGIIGPRTYDKSRAEKARAKLTTVALPGLAEAPVLRKDGHPGEMWVSLVTMGAGVHGLLLLALGARYLRRRARRREALRTGQIDDAEEEFFRTETLD